jgi:hypothetical protein
VFVTFAGITCRAGAILHQGTRVFVAVPASCGGIEPGKVQDGCAEAEAPLGVPVHIAGARHHGTLVYNSFTEMQLHGVRSPTRCYYNDLALVRVNRHVYSRVSGAIPGTAGPRRVSGLRPAAGAQMTAGSDPATAGRGHHHGWERDVTVVGDPAPSDVGEPVMSGNHLLGMLTVLPSGVLVAAPGEVYSLAKALEQLHKVPGFRHVTLLRAGQRV